MIITTDTTAQTSFNEAIFAVGEAIMEDTIIEDTTAVTIAAAWQSPQSSLATLASTGKVNSARLRADIDRELSGVLPGSEDEELNTAMLTALLDWVSFKERG